MSPAHNIDDLRTSYEYKLPRTGCLDSETGCLTKPLVLEGTDISDEAEANSRVKSILQDEGNYYATFMH